jgi:hypothetical protein
MLGNFLVAQALMGIRFNIPEDQFRKFAADLPEDVRDLMPMWSLLYLMWLMRMSVRLKRGEEFEAEMMQAAYGRLMGAPQTLELSATTVPFANAMRQWFDFFDAEGDAAFALRRVEDDDFPAVEWKVAMELLMRDRESPYYVDTTTINNKDGHHHIERIVEDLTSHMNGIDFAVAKALANAKNSALPFILTVPEMKSPS